MEWVSKINFVDLLDDIFGVLFKIIKMPFDAWNKLPSWVKLIVFGIIGVVAIIVIIAAYRNREEYLSVQY